MKENELLEGIKKAIPEGVELDVSKLDIKGLNVFVNDDTNNIVASKKAGFMEEGRNGFLTEKGFKDADAFDKFKSTAESSDSELLKKFNKLDGEHKTLTSDHAKLNQSVINGKEVSRLTSSGEDGFNVDPKFSKFVHSEFSTAKAAAKEKGTELKMEDWAKGYFEKNKQFQQPSKSTGRRSNNQPIEKFGDDKKAFLKDRYKDRHKK